LILDFILLEVYADSRTYVRRIFEIKISYRRDPTIVPRHPTFSSPPHPLFKVEQEEEEK